MPFRIGNKEQILTTQEIYINNKNKMQAKLRNCQKIT